MSSNTTETHDVQLLATYGTLRDDNDTGASYTKSFVEGISDAVTGRLAGYQLLGHRSAGFPFAIFTGNPKDSIVVRLLSWPTKEQFAEKIATADRIEGSAYERKVVEVQVEGENRRAYIYVSNVSSLEDSWKVIPSGDWLKRNVQ